MARVIELARRERVLNKENGYGIVGGLQELRGAVESGTQRVQRDGEQMPAPRKEFGSQSLAALVDQYVSHRTKLVENGEKDDVALWNLKWILGRAVPGFGLACRFSDVAEFANDPDAVPDWMRGLRRQNGEPYSPETLVLWRRILVKFGHWCEARHKTHANPFRDVEWPQQKARKKTLLMVAEFLRIVNHASGNIIGRRQRAMLLCYVSGAFRSTELLWADWPDVKVRLVSGVVIPAAAWDSTSGRFVTAFFTVRAKDGHSVKTEDSERTVPIKDRLTLDALAEYIMLVPAEKRLGPMWPTQQTDRFSAAGMLKSWFRLQEKAGVALENRCDIRRLRKLGRTVQHRAGVDKASTQSIMGHKPGSRETDATYLVQDVDDLEAAVSHGPLDTVAQRSGAVQVIPAIAGGSGERTVPPTGGLECDHSAGRIARQGKVICRVCGEEVNDSAA